MSDTYVIIYSKTGAAAVYLPVTKVGDTYVVDGISVTGLGLTTAGVTDSVDKRFVTDAQKTLLDNLVGTEQLLATQNANLNSATPNVLYTVPVGKTAIITKLVVRGASVELDTASFSVGYNSTDFNDVIANATHVELVDNSVYSILPAKAGAALGVAAAELTLLANTLQGAAATVTVDVYGYLL